MIYKCITNDYFKRYVYNSSRLCFPMEVKPRNRCLMIFTAYIDESGTHADSQDIVLAGYISILENWSAFEAKWKAALADANLTSFHMTDFANHASPYDKWSEADRKSRLQNFITLANAYTVCSIGIILPRSEYLAAMGKASRGFPGREYGLAAQWLLGLVPAALTRFHDRDPQIAYVLDQGAHRSNHVITMINRMMKDQRKAEGLKFLSIRLERREIFVPLQASDILAYELYRYASNLNMTPSRSLRWPFTRLKTESSYWFRLSKSDIQGLIKPKIMSKFEYVADLMRPHCLLTPH